ncbi:MAG: thiosulfate oxidation carrier complex protein SoxZ [Methylococcales bacterium]|nr:thiosulfate oxidation carrier complex protein SoxZ [Methylococcales bacterium]
MPSIKIRTQQIGDQTEIRLLIRHPMENGRNRDANGELIPAHFIVELDIRHNKNPVILVHMAGSIARNPFFSFRLNNAANGDIITASWTDNRQLSDSVEHTLYFDQRT